MTEMVEMTTEEKFILITGANGGVGYGLCQRIAAHCTNNDVNTTITLVLACRNSTKARSAMTQLRQEFPLAFTSNRLRVDLLQIDLSSPQSVMEACKEYRNRFHQLDVLYCNAGVLPIDGLDLWMGVGNLVRDPLRFFTDVSSTLRQKRNLRIAGHEKLGLVFTANVLSHYVMIRELESVLGKAINGGRVVWTGSQTSEIAMFSWADLQGIGSASPYESSKVASEILCQSLNNDYQQRQLNIQSFVADPGVVSTSIVSGAMSSFMQYFLIIPTLYLARLFLDCVVFTPWFGALSLFYLSALQPSSSGSVVVKMEKSLQSAQATEMKYASRENYLRGKEYVECAAINPEFIASSRSGRMLMELDKLRSKHFTLN